MTGSDEVAQVFEGVDGRIEIDHDSRTIQIVRGIWDHRKSVSIAYERLTGVDFREATVLERGFVALRLDGHSPAKRPRNPLDITRDLRAPFESNTVMFKRNQLPDFVRLHDWLLRVVEHSSTVVIANGLADEKTSVTIYKDGTFKTSDGRYKGEQLVSLKCDTDSMRRKSVTGRVVGISAATLATQGINLFTDAAVPKSNNRGVAYLTLVGSVAGTHVYSQRNPSNKLLEDHRLLQAATDALLNRAPTDDSENRGVSADRIADELEKLAGLRDRGILTDDEFAAQKNRLLNTDQI